MYVACVVKAVRIHIASYYKFDHLLTSRIYLCRVLTTSHDDVRIVRIDIQYTEENGGYPLGRAIQINRCARLAHSYLVTLQREEWPSRTNSMLSPPTSLLSGLSIDLAWL